VKETACLPLIIGIGISDWMKGKKAEECIECGVCETKCPQKIQIRKQLKETAMALG